MQKLFCVVLFLCCFVLFYIRNDSNKYVNKLGSNYRFLITFFSCKPTHTKFQSILDHFAFGIINLSLVFDKLANPPFCSFLGHFGDFKTFQKSLQTVLRAQIYIFWSYSTSLTILHKQFFFGKNILFYFTSRHYAEDKRN